MKLTIKTICAAGFILSLSSCLKEDPYFDPAQSNNVIEFANTGDLNNETLPRFYSDLGTLAAGSSTTINININTAGPNMAGSDITVGLELDQAALDNYNSVEGASYVIPPASVFSFPSSVVIKKGTNRIQAQATITNSADFSFDDAYALPIKIASVSDGTPVSANFGTALYSFGVRNAYDGHYSIKGYTLRAGDNVLSGNFTGKTMDLETTGKSSVAFGAAQFWGNGSAVGIPNPQLTINADNSVTVFNADGGAKNNPAYNSRYEPETKTFYISFSWGAGPASRLATDTLTYIGER